MITSKLLAQIFPATSQRSRDRFIKALNKYLPLYGIDTHLRVSAFLATGGVETDYLRTTTEYASGEAYEGRKDLGNTVAGDGVRFKGRGFFQTTGRYNYTRVQKLLGAKLGIDFLRKPERLAEIDVAVESACIFWKENNLAKYADSKEFKKFSAVVNCGNPNAKPNHWAKRNELYSKCIRYIPKDFSFSESVQIAVAVPDVPTVNQPIENSAEDLTNPVVLTPTNPAQPNTDQPANPDASVAPPTEEKSKVKEFGDKYLRHCPQDTVKNILAVVIGRIVAGIATIWALGLHGQIFLIVAGVIVAGLVIYSLYNYSGRIFGWIKDVADSFLGI